MTAKEKPARHSANGTGKRLAVFRLENGYTYRRLAELIGGLAPNTVRRAELGGHLTARIAYKIKRFLNRALHA